MPQARDQCVFGYQNSQLPKKESDFEMNLFALSCCRAISS